MHKQNKTFVEEIITDVPTPYNGLTDRVLHDLNQTGRWIGHTGRLKPVFEAQRDGVLYAKKKKYRRYIYSLKQDLKIDTKNRQNFFFLTVTFNQTVGLTFM